MKIQIKDRWTGKVLFEYEHKDNSIKRTVEKAVEAGANLEGARLEGANLEGAHLVSAHLEGARLEGANLEDARLEGVRLVDAHLEGAHLVGAHLVSARLEGAHLEGARLVDAHLKGANLEGARLEGARLVDAHLEGAHLVSARLEGANLEGANLEGARLKGANLEGARLTNAKGVPKIDRNDLSIIKHQDCMLRAYKYLNGNKSPYQNYEYEVGKEYTFDDINTDETVLCGAGGNVATLEWCLRNTNCDLDKTYIEVEFHSKDAIIPLFSDGKFRVRKFKVLRKLNREELKPYLE